MQVCIEQDLSVLEEELDIQKQAEKVDQEKEANYLCHRTSVSADRTLQLRWGPTHPRYGDTVVGPQQN